MIILSSQDHYQNVLLENIGFPPSTDVQFLTQHILPSVISMGEQYIDNIMTKVLDMCQLLHYPSELTTLIRDLQFVKVASGPRKCPAKLLDPRDSNLANIFRGENVFPNEPYSAFKYLDILEHCGLHTSVTPQEILDVIHSISSPANTSPQLVNKSIWHRAMAILQYIASSNFPAEDTSTCRLDAKIYCHHVTFQEALLLLSTKCSWLPILSERPNDYPSCLLWKGKEYISHFVSLKGPVCVSKSNSTSLPLAYGSQAYFTHPCDYLEADKPTQCLVLHLNHVIASKDKVLPDQMMAIVSVIYLAMLDVVKKGSNIPSFS